MDDFDVFVSRPTALHMRQQHFCDALTELFKVYGLHPRTLGVTDYSNKVPLLHVHDIMLQCSGVAVIGFAQTLIKTGIAKAGTPKQQTLAQVRLPTAWNQLEAGLAFALHLPLLVVREQNLAPDGIFDAGVTDRFVHRARLTDEWIESQEFLQPFEEWVDEVRRTGSEAS